MTSTTRWLVWLVALVALVPAASRAAGAIARSEQDKVPVYVFTAPPASRMITADDKRRAEALKQLTRYLRKKHRIVLSEDPQNAKVVIELLSHVQTFQPHQGKRIDENELTAVIKVGKEETRIAESRRDVSTTADKLAVRIDHWIRDNVSPPAK